MENFRYPLKNLSILYEYKKQVAKTKIHAAGWYVTQSDDKC